MEFNDYDKIVPRAVRPGGATVRPLEIAIRTMLDYDANYMQDRIRSEIFINGRYAGVYAATTFNEAPRDEYERRQVLECYGPELERGLVDEFMGLGYRKRVKALEEQVSRLEAHINRTRWWHFRPVRREWNVFRARLAERISP